MNTKTKQILKFMIFMRTNNIENLKCHKTLESEEDILQNITIICKNKREVQFVNNGVLISYTYRFLL